MSAFTQPAPSDGFVRCTGREGAAQCRTCPRQKVPVSRGQQVERAALGHRDWQATCPYENDERLDRKASPAT
jgi:hypothetical protein